MKYKHIHFVGIKGVGVAPLALIAKEAGCTVTGSDIGDTFITDPALRNAGIQPFVGFAKEHITGAELVVTTGAHGGYENVEVQAAKEKKIPVLSQGAAVGEFMNGELFGRHTLGISVAGSHGKTTTTAMVATILQENELDPSYVIGTGDIVSLAGPGHFGKGEYFIAEADEYITEPKHDKTPKFLWQHPHIAIFTNIELDHPDVYGTVDEVRNAFLRFARSLSEDSVLVVCGDDSQIQLLLKDYSGRAITYGFHGQNKAIVSHVRMRDERLEFCVTYQGERATFTLCVPGVHNALNATAALITAGEIGLSVAAIQNGLRAFRGTKRRLEYIGRLASGALLYDDYAHHPTEIQTSLAALKQQYPTKRLVCVFQPHTYSRTKKLFEQFITSFLAADILILTSIYASKREVADPTISSEMLRDNIAQKQQVILLPELTEVVEYLNQQSYTDDVVIVTMGAGDIYQIAGRLEIKK